MGYRYKFLVQIKCLHLGPESTRNMKFHAHVALEKYHVGQAHAVFKTLKVFNFAFLKEYVIARSAGHGGL